MAGEQWFQENAVTSVQGQEPDRGSDLTEVSLEM